ncbi:hypothetical protein Tco_1259385 [Tanacetum coccineum]
MELRIIEGITSKGKGDPPGITMEDGKAWTNSILTKELVTGEWKEERKKAKPAETHVLMISRKSCNPRKRYAEEDYNKIGL